MTVDDEVLECMLSAMRATPPWDDPKAPYRAGLQAVFDKYVTPLEADCKRFESAYLELRDKLPVPCAMPPNAVYRTVAFEHNEKYNATLKAKLHVWYIPETAEVLRVDIIPRDPIKEEAHNLAALHSLQGIPVDAIERVLREVRK